MNIRFLFIFGFIFIAIFATAAGCSSAQEISRPDGKKEYLVACGASTGWDICYRRANEICPQGYETITEKPGFNRKEMRIACAQ
ncbi:MAG: hypothetical protein VBE63_09785 [Lamprobacter sp.]|uniref:hypothetical protein n=1 Tax=Lamprobacter sp. TaxID=3100796 RepID=UPI002B259C24|nr:hypothetical protein [Lamprobacter sp.]MEA3640220.1 hypothetical protein [Lamprobacter sp.]